MSSNSSAVSNIVIYYGGAGGDSSVTITNDFGFTLVETQSELANISNPDEIRVAFIKNGGSGAVDVAFWNETTQLWEVFQLQGIKGADGEDGEDGIDGVGLPGSDGADGAKGAKGDPPAHEWSGTLLRFQNPDGSWGVFVDVSGEDGTDGEDGLNGLDGAKGDRPAHQWTGTQLRFQNADGTWGAYVDLKGEIGNGADHEWSGTSIRFRQADGTWGLYTDLQGAQGAIGADGAPPEHEINQVESEIRWRNPDGTWGDWLSTKGDQGLPPEHQVLGAKVRFRNPDGTWGDYVELDNVRDIVYQDTPPIDPSTGLENYNVIWAEPHPTAGHVFKVYDADSTDWIDVLGDTDNVMTLSTFYMPQHSSEVAEIEGDFDLNFTLELARDVINDLSYPLTVGGSEIKYLVTFQGDYLYTLRFQGVGKGTYGLNGSSIDSLNLYVVKTEILSKQAIMEIGTSELIDLGDIGVDTIENAFSTANPDNTVQTIPEGLTVVTAIMNGSERSFLFVGAAGDYGSTTGDAVAADFREINNTRVTDVPTNTSQLLNDGEDGINPFIDEADRVVLQDQVTANRTDIDALLGGAGDGFKYLQIAYIDGFTFNVTAEWVIGGVTIPRKTVSVTADDANALLDRIDSIICDVNGDIFFRKGTAENNPSKPVFSALTELEATFVYISAGATAPDGFTSFVIYDENLQVAGGEWDTLAVNGTGVINLASPNNPSSGTVTIEATQLGQYDGIRFIPPAPIPIAEVEQISYDIRNKAGNYGNGDTHRFMLYGEDINGNLITVVLPADTNYKSNNTNQQSLTCTVPASTALVQVNYIMFLNYAQTNKEFGFYLDNVRIATVDEGTPNETGDYATVAYVDDRDNAIIAVLSSKEDKVNKVQDLNTPSATTYPSTQAVVTYVQANKDKNYLHNQSTPASVWTINHNLAKFPAVHVKDSAGSVVEGDVDYTDINNLTITFNGSFSGEATLN